MAQRPSRHGNSVEASVTALIVLVLLAGLRFSNVQAAASEALPGLVAAGHRDAWVAGVARYSTRVWRFLEDVLGVVAARVHMTYRMDLPADV